MSRNLIFNIFNFFMKVCYKFEKWIGLGCIIWNENWFEKIFF